MMTFFVLPELHPWYQSFDTMDGVQAIQKMSSYHLSKGTTSLLATTWTSSFEHTYAALNDFNSLIDMSSNLIGVHLEGPRDEHLLN